MTILYVVPIGKSDFSSAVFVLDLSQIPNIPAGHMTPGGDPLFDTETIGLQANPDTLKLKIGNGVAGLAEISNKDSFGDSTKFGILLVDVTTIINGKQEVYLRISNVDRIFCNTTGIGFFGASPVAKPSALTPADTDTPGLIYGATERDIISNLQTRVNELEAKLQSLGLLS